MNGRKYKVLLVCSHPVQYASPAFRQMAQHPKLDILVAYCSLLGAEPMTDSEFGIQVTWDVPLLEGYPWIRIPNRSRRVSLERFFGLTNPGLWKILDDPRYDAVVVYTGYRYATFWIVAAAAKAHRKALLLGTDAHDLGSRDGRSWKRWLKVRVWPYLFGSLADVVIVPSSDSVALMRSIGVPEARVMLTPYTVNNEWWKRQAELVNRAEVRNDWRVPDCAPVVLFCAKLQPWKRPLDVLRAFVKAEVPQAYLVYAGDGPLRSEVEREARSLGVAERVRFLGFKNQSQLPSVYVASDILVLPSEHEPFGVVVNEAMLCGRPAIVSDRVGAAHDLISAGQNGYVFPLGDVGALAEILHGVLHDPERLQQLGRAAKDRIEGWSPRENVEALVGAVERAIQLRQSDT